MERPTRNECIYWFAQLKNQGVGLNPWFHLLYFMNNSKWVSKCKPSRWDPSHPFTPFLKIERNLHHKPQVSGGRVWVINQPGNGIKIGLSSMDERTHTTVPWRQWFRYPPRNECMSWFAQTQKSRCETKLMVSSTLLYVQLQWAPKCMPNRWDPN